MISRRNMLITRNVLFLINLAIIVFLSIVIYKTIDLICWNGIARKFLEKVKCVPTIPWQVPVFSMTLLSVFFASVMIREHLNKEQQFLFYLFSASDLLIVIAIMYFLNMSYKGVLFLAIINIVVYIDGTRRKYLVLLGAILVYILFDYDILSIKMNLFSINDYVQYYTSAQRLYIFGIRNILFSLNEMIFIVFMVFAIQSQIDENTKIKELYGKLYQTAEELRVVNVQLEDYSNKLEETAKIRERNRLAREIHDTIGHNLTGIATGLEACRDLIDRDVEKTKVQIGKISDMAKKGLVDVRRSVNELRPDTLERFTLVPAICKLSEDINDCTNTKVTLDISGEEIKLNADEEETIYRIIQEGITNAVRHGNAKMILIKLEFKNGDIFLEISDDGKGCAKIVEGFGLKYIKERVGMLAGSVEFGMQESGGFRIFAHISVRGRMKA
jgi:signal transduction histidine kinase